MNCGPARNDPRSDKERKLLCDDCLPASIALADYSQEQIDALTHGEIADRLRRYGHPLLKAAADSIDYLDAQEGLLEQAQQAAEHARAELAEHKRPLDEPMARLNRRVIELTAELDALRIKLPGHAGVGGTDAR